MEPRLKPYLDALAAGEVIAIPTDTVYGLAAVPTDYAAVQRIFELKGRPEDKPLPILGATIDQLRSIAALDERAEELAKEFWPGPLTIVLPRAAGFNADLGGDDRETIAVRVPEHDLTRALLQESGPLAATSANLSGEAPAASAADVARILPGILALDGGPAAGTPSTVLSLLGPPEILRAGPPAFLRKMSVAIQRITRAEND